MVGLIHSWQVVKFGSFTLKGGHETPVYFDLRRLISYPKILKTAAQLIDAVVQEVGRGVAQRNVCVGFFLFFNSFITHGGMNGVCKLLGEKRGKMVI